MMLRILTTFALATMVSGCTVEAAEEPAPVDTNEVEAADDVGGLYRGEQDDPPDICITGEWKYIGGFWINVPVFCVRDDPYRGDPGPLDEIADPRIFPGDDQGQPGTPAY